MRTILRGKRGINMDIPTKSIFKILFPLSMTVHGKFPITQTIDRPISGKSSESSGRFSEPNGQDFYIRS